jgi:RadC-like JAB domain-containing protein
MKVARPVRREGWKKPSGEILTIGASVPTLRDPSPSQEDMTITKRLRETGEIMGIRVLDHIVFGDNRYLSFVDDGYWDRL